MRLVQSNPVLLNQTFFFQFQELTAICDELIAKVGSWQDQYRAECKTKLVKTGQTYSSDYRTEPRRQNKLSNSRDNLPASRLRRDRSFVLETSSEVLLRRQRSASRESTPTLRHGSRMTRPVSVPYGTSGVGLHTLATSSDHSVSTTPRRSHSDCYTRSSPKQVRKFKAPSKKMWIPVYRRNT